MAMLRSTVMAAAAWAFAAAQVEQVHLAYYGTTRSVTDGMIVSWTTSSPTPAPAVLYGDSPSTLTNMVNATVVNYLVPPRGSFHSHALITGLQAGVTYFYKCGDAAGFSDVYSFTTAPAEDQFPLDVVVYADMGIVNSHESMIEVSRIISNSTFTWHVGDVSYADDAYLEDPLVFGYETVYNEFMRNMTTYALMPTKPYMVNPGNHEAECHSPICFLDPVLRKSLGNFSAYNGRWRMPYEPSGSTNSMWYSFQIGSVRFINIDTETDYPNAPLDEYASKNGGFGDQMGWLEAELQDAAAGRAAGTVSWILVGGHRPLYTIQDQVSGVPKPGTSSNAAQAAFEPLFNKYGVDLYVCGHQHAYESIWPTLNGTSVVQSFDNPPYTTYVITGSAGNVEGLSNYTGHVAPAWERTYNTQDFGVSRMRIIDRNTLTFDFRRATDGAVLDSWTLTRQH